MCTLCQYGIRLYTVIMASCQYTGNEFSGEHYGKWITLKWKYSHIFIAGVNVNEKYEEKKINNDNLNYILSPETE